MSMGANASRVVSLYVRNLPWTVSDRELFQYFRKFGFVSRTKVMFDDNTGMSKGFGFVQFTKGDSVENALRQNIHRLEGNIIEINTYNKKNF